MKRFLLFTAACILALQGCEKNEPSKEEKSVAMTSFGFYSEDNPGVLNSDVLLEGISSASLTVRLPFGTSNEALKTLVPRFVTTEGASVIVGEKTVESGKTALDFSSPVDFIVSLDGTNALYTVTVLIVEPTTWRMAAESQSQIYAGPVLATSPSDGSVYMLATSAGADSKTRFPVLYRYDSGKISEKTVAESGAKNLALEVSSDGAAYVSYYDYSASPVGQTVMKVSGDAVSAVGAAGSVYKSGGNTLTSVALFPFTEDNVWYAGYNDLGNAGVARRALNLAHFTGTDWANGQNMPGRNAEDRAYNNIGRIVGKTAYLCTHNQNTHSVSVYKYENNVWSAVFESIKIAKLDGSDAEINLRDMDFDVASDGNIYLAVAANFTSETYSPAVVRYDIKTGKQTIIAGVLSNVDIDSGRNISLSLDANDVPHLVYEGNTDGITYLTYINANRQWSDPVAISSGASDGCAIRFAEDGTGYIAFKDASPLADGGTKDRLVLFTNSAE